jgi:hypothetical protein
MRLFESGDFGGRNPQDRIPATAIISNILILLLLFFLPVYGCLQIFFSYREIGEGYRHVFDATADQNISETLDSIANRISIITERVVSSTGNTPPLSGSSLETMTSLPIMNFDNDLFENQCQPIKRYSDRNFGYGCTAYLSWSNYDDSEIDNMAMSIRNMSGRHLKELFYSLNQIPFDMTPEEIEKLKDIKVSLVYSLLEIKDDNIEFEMLVIYPSVKIDKDFYYDNRPWYPIRDNMAFASKETSHAKKAKVVFASDIYHDYVTRELTLSAVCPKDFASGRLQVVADIHLPKFERDLVLISFNLVFAVGAILVYAYSYRVTRRPFLRYLCLSTAVLMSFWSVVALSAVLAAMDISDISTKSLLFYLAPFLPSNTFLLLSARRLLKGSDLDAIKEGATYFVLEEAIALNSIFFDGAVLASLFNFIALAYFGYAVLSLNSWIGYGGNTQNDRSIAVLCKWTAISYWFWGLSQFSILIAGSSTKSFVFNGIIDLPPSIELLFVGPAGALLILSYPKAVAIVLTMKLLNDLMKIRNRRLAGEQHRIYVDRKGSIVGVDMPIDFAAKGKLVDYIEDKRDSKEIEAAIASNFYLKDYVCRLPRAFGNQWIRVSISESFAGKPDYPREIVVSMIDMAAIITRLDRSQLLIVSSVLSSIDEHLESISEQESAVSISVNNSNSYIDELRASITEAKLRIGYIDPKEILSENKASTQELWDIFHNDITMHDWSEYAIISKDRDYLDQMVPCYLRINTKVFLEALAHINYSVGRCLKQEVGMKSFELRLYYRKPPRRFASEETNFFTFGMNFSRTVSLSVLGTALKDTIRPQVSFGPKSQVWEGRLRIAERMLNLFGGRLEIVPNDEEARLDLEIQIQTLISS